MNIIEFACGCRAEYDPHIGGHVVNVLCSMHCSEEMTDAEIEDAVLNMDVD